MSTPTTSAMAARLVQDGAASDSADLLASLVLDRLRYAEDGQATVLDLHGNPALNDTGAPVGVADLLSGFRRAMPQLFVPPEPKEKDVGQALRRGFKAPADPARRTADKIEAALAAGNPYAAGSTSVTRQAMIEALDPNKAAELRAEAGR